jgi:hypothetical protein
MWLLLDKDGKMIVTLVGRFSSQVQGFACSWIDHY